MPKKQKLDTIEGQNQIETPTGENNNSSDDLKLVKNDNEQAHNLISVREEFKESKVDGLHKIVGEALSTDSLWRTSLILNGLDWFARNCHMRGVAVLDGSLATGDDFNLVDSYFAECQKPKQTNVKHKKKKSFYCITR